ncbi:N-acetylgalactosamine-6-sulfatase-like isoform X1 [Dysidea avara]|uniref:N-acetylgalactosamine-6-sulfatase-like isoform X1 n=2 Tax=Dysidea avara TaxID=196820 RepID=UPI00332CDF84
MNFGSILLYCSVLLLQAGLLLGDRPNIIFLLADDLGWGDVGYNGGVASTPFLNRMSKSDHSIVLTHHYSGSPVCSPTRGTILTGRNHNRYCMWSSNTAKGDNEIDFKHPQTMPLPTREETVAEVLREAGYRTAMYGKWHLGSLKDIVHDKKTWPKVDPGMHGFDEWYATERTVPTANSNLGCFRNKTLSRCTNYYFKNQTSQLFPYPYPIDGDDSDFIAQLTLDFMSEQVRKKQPFFAYVAFHAVHKPTIAVGKYKKLYIQKNYTPTEANYYGTITAMDAAIGKIRRVLKILGIDNNTLVWFTSDNGPAQGNPGSTNSLMGRKGSLLEGGIRVPGLIEWPAVINENRWESYPVVTNDFLPTVRDIIKSKQESNLTIDGESILPLMNKSIKNRKSPIHWMFKYPPDKRKYYQQVTIDNKYKLVQDFLKGKVQDSRLYDLNKNSGELRDIKLRHNAVFNKLQKEAEKWKQSVMKDIKQCGNPTVETVDHEDIPHRSNLVSRNIP